MINFENTKIAFDSKSKSDLRWSYRLFNWMGKAWFVRLGKVASNLAFKLHLPINKMVRKTIFKQFCGGETIEESQKRINELFEYGIGSILDFSVEGKETDKEFDATKNELIQTIETAKSSKAIPFSVFKVTGISRFALLEKINSGLEELTDVEKAEYKRVVDRVDAICKACVEADVPVFIDAEDSWIQDGIDRLAMAMMIKYNKNKAIVFNTIQMYRHDRLEFLKMSHHQTQQAGVYLGIKLVRGAYMEKESNRAREKGYPDPIQPSKEATDRDYNLALDYIIKNIGSIALCAGTHNEESSAYLTQLMEENQIKKDHPHVYFAQLLGMSDHISFNLAHLDYNVVKYVPYGPIKEVMPYLIRRAEENTSVAGQVSRELGLIVKEMERRKMD